MYTLYHHQYSHQSPVSLDGIKRIGPKFTDRVQQLVDQDVDETELLFGKINVQEILCKSFESIGILNNDNRLVGTISLHNYPNISSLPPWEWNHWLYNAYGLDHLHTISTLWIHFIVFDPNYCDLSEALMRRIFELHPIITNIALVVPPGVRKVKFFDTKFRILPKDFTTLPKRVQTLYILNRNDFVCNYKIRYAVEEDNDDIVTIIDRVSTRLRTEYGDYYIAELLKDHQKLGRHIIVAEHNNYVVAVLCLNENVNYDLLNEHFELIPFMGLRKPTNQDEFDLKYHDNDDVISMTTSSSSSDRQVERLSGQDTFLASALKPSPYGSFMFLSNRQSSNEMIDDNNTSSDDIISLVNVSSSLIYNLYMYEGIEPNDVYSKSDFDILSGTESAYSTIVLNYDDMVNQLSAVDMFSYHQQQQEQQSHVNVTNSLLINAPIFYGSENAFTLELVGCELNHDFALSLLYNAAFECQSNRDYCVVSIPTQAHAPSENFHQYFNSAAAKMTSNFPHDLYLLHRNAICGRTNVRIADTNDKLDVVKLTCTIIKHETVIKQFNLAVDDPDSNYRAFVMTSEEQIIGVAILSEQFEANYLATYYDLNAWINVNHHKPGSYGLIENIVFSPIFQCHSIYFLRELHRLSDFSVLFYLLKMDDLSTHRNRPIANVIQTLLPVLPRYLPQVNANNDKLESYERPRIVPKQAPFALYLSSMRNLSTPRKEINTRVVVVGAGHTTVAFLESLLLTQTPDQMVTFTNVTVISPHGIGHDKDIHPIRDRLFVQNGYFERHIMNTITIQTYINVVANVMVHIDRKKKYIITDNNKGLLPYDLLILTCGEQFQKPIVTGNDYTKLPKNVYIVNTALDGSSALGKLKGLMKTKPRVPYAPVLVHGSYLEVYCCLAALMEFGILPEQLILIIPPATASLLPTAIDRHKHLTLFNNSEIYECVLATIRSLGIIIHQGYNLINWTLTDNTTGDDEQQIRLAKFESKHESIELECMAMFVYGRKSISYKTFQAIHAAGLVYDGRLVINRMNRTNDPCIFAAGTLTKLSRKYHAHGLNHKYFNPDEIGYKLGQQIKQILIKNINTVHNDDDNVDGKNDFVYKKPNIHYCIFPGNLHYLSVKKCGRVIPLMVAMSKENYEFEVDNLIQLWGKHETLLNNLFLRYERYGIDDFYCYFQQPWAYAIYFDHFDFLMDHFQAILTEIQVDGGIIIDDARHDMNSKSSLSGISESTSTSSSKSSMRERQIATISNELRDLIERHPQHDLIQTKLMDFLQENYTYLPMYAQRMLVAMFVQSVQTHPMFKVRNTRESL